MAPISKTLTLAGAFFAAVGTAAPLNKREDVVVWETVTDVVWTTIDTTITITPGQTAPATVIPITTVVPTTSTTVTPSSSSSSSSSIYTPPPPTQAPAPPATSAHQPAPTTSSAPVVTSAPAPQPPAPEPAPSSSSSSSSASAPAPSSSAPSDSDNGGVCSQSAPCSGDGTYYDTATSASAPSSCGFTNDGLAENVIALPVGMMQDSDCGKTVTISYDGKTSTAKVVDKCMGCQGNSIDMSRHLFGSLADMAEGRLSNVQWWFN
ncbi:hypothetical protein VTN00DRAFT_1424 [Thermoascus crustaceus]|uniref:uncharacterized protein n=1 Tax=Thermoascus crustaceus TaxID=5088 RepID=UPI0037433A56